MTGVARLGSALMAQSGVASMMEQIALWERLLALERMPAKLAQRVDFRMRLRQTLPMIAKSVRWADLAHIHGPQRLMPAWAALQIHTQRKQMAHISAQLVLGLRTTGVAPLLE